VVWEFFFSGSVKARPIFDFDRARSKSNSVGDRFLELFDRSTGDVSDRSSIRSETLFPPRKRDSIERAVSRSRGGQSSRDCAKIDRIRTPRI